MVQRKVPSKISIPKNDTIKQENRAAVLKPLSPRFLDGKNKEIQVYKKLKRSKLMKRSSSESGSETSKLIKEVPQPGKPPTDEKQKKLPNYMKSTSSFKARNEEPQVNSQAYVRSTKKGLEKSQPSSNSAHMPSKTLTRTSSLKRIRTIKKTLSIQLIKVANKNSSQAVLCEDSNSQRATCSSTLKDSKFPNYLELSHGATESEGTSLMKVCPYTYCSLNGHRHALLPPLKSFISAKRRMIKTQKNIKYGCVSPRKEKLYRDVEKEINRGMVIDEKAAIQAPRVQEDNGNFDVEIYVGIKGDDSKIGSEMNKDEGIDEFSNEAPNSGNDLENNCNHCEAIGTNSEFFPQEEEVSEVVSYGTDCETNDIEWEEGQNHNEEKDGYHIGKGSSGTDPSFYDESNCFNEILVGEIEEVYVQFVNEGTEFINSKEDKLSNAFLEDKEPGAMLANQGQDSGEAQQEEINEDYEFIENNNQVFELEVSHEDVLVEYLSVDTKNLATNQIIEQKMGEKELNNINEPLSGESNDDHIFKSLDSIDYNDQTHIELNKVIIADEFVPDIDAMEATYSDNSDHSGSSSVDKDETQKRSKIAYTRGKGRSSEDLQSNTFNLQITKRKKSEDDLDREREFNPREPNYLPVTPDPEGEKVDLKHQDLDDRKNAEEWMIDYALRQTVGRLGARKKKVALLVEAFEKVAPLNSDFASIRPIQACI